MKDDLVCWKCGKPVSSLPMPLSRIAECLACHSELHVCLMCKYYNTRISDGCDEPAAEYVHDKKRANFCDYFTIMPDAYQPQGSAETDKAKAELEALFGTTANDSTSLDNQDVSEEAQQQ